MTIHETRTRMEPAEVIERARSFFVLAGTSYAAFPERRTEGWLRLRVEAAEIVIGTARKDGVTLVRGSASRGGHLLTAFLTTLAQPHDAEQTTHRAGVCRRMRTAVETYVGSEAVSSRAAGEPAAQAA